MAKDHFNQGDDCDTCVHKYVRLDTLRDLMQVDGYPLDYTKRPTTQAAAWYRDTLREIKQQLDGAGVPTREVFFNQQQKRAYMENPENRRKEREQYQEERRAGTPGRLWR